MLRITYDKNIFMIVSLTFVALMGFPIISPALPAVRDALNISTKDIGWVMAAYSLPGIVFMPLSGLLADRYGKRKVLFPSLFIFAFAGGACSLAPDQETLYSLRFIQGVGASALSTLNFAMVGDYYKGQDRVRLMSFISGTQNIASGLLPLAGGALAAIAWFYPFGASLLAIPLGLYMILMMDEVRVESGAKASGTRAFLGHAWSKLNNRIVIEIVFMAGGFIFIGFGAFITYMPLLLNDRFNSSGILIGLIIATRATMGAAMASQLARLTRLYSYRTLVFWAFLVMAIGMTFVPFADSQWMLIITAMCYGGSFGILRPSLQILLLNHAPEDLRSTFISTMNLGLRIAQTTSPVCAGLLLVSGSYNNLFIIAGALSAFMAIFSLTAVSLKR